MSLFISDTCSAQEQGFFIYENEDSSLEINSTPITVFPAEGIISPGSRGEGTFVIRNEEVQAAVAYELQLTKGSSWQGGLSLHITLHLDTQQWAFPTTKSLSSVAQIATTNKLAPGEEHTYQLTWHWKADDDLNRRIQEATQTTELSESLQFKLLVEGQTSTTVQPADTNEIHENEANKKSTDNNQKKFPQMGAAQNATPVVGLIVLLVVAGSFCFKRKRQPL